MQGRKRLTSTPTCGRAAKLHPARHVCIFAVLSAHGRGVALRRAAISAKVRSVAADSLGAATACGTISDRHKISSGTGNLPVVNAGPICAVEGAGVGLINLSSGQIVFHQAVVLEAEVVSAGPEIIERDRWWWCQCRVLVSRAEHDSFSPCCKLSAGTRDQLIQEIRHTEIRARTLVVLRVDGMAIDDTPLRRMSVAQSQ